ncbi:MAG: MFS transporter [Promethearchaeota archaeon]
MKIVRTVKTAKTKETVKIMRKPLNSEMLRKAKHRNLYAFMVKKFIAGFGDACANIAYIPFVYEVTNYNLILTGLLVTFSALMWFIPAPISGKLSDRFGRKKMMVISRPIAIIGIILLFFVNQNSLYLLVISIILRSVGYMSVNMNNSILVSESNDKENNGLGHVFGIMAFLYFSSTIAGAIFVNRTGYDYKIYFLILMIFNIISWIITVIWITETTEINTVEYEKNGRITSQKKGWNGRESWESWKAIFKKPKVKTAIIFLTLDFFVWDISNSVLIAGMQSQYGLTLEDLAFFQIWFYVFNMILQIPAGKLTDKMGKRKMLLISELIGIVIFTLHILTSILWSLGYEKFLFPSLIVIYILFAIVATTFIPSESMILTDLDETRKGESFGMVSFIVGLGAIPTGVIGGFLMGSVHFVAPFITTIVGLIFIIVFLIKFGHRFEDEERAEEK